jgi:hypothetical protein
MHCNENPIYRMHSFFGNCAASLPISTFICVCERFIYSQDRSTYFPAAEKADPSWEFINRSQTHECGNWDCGRASPFLGIFVSVFRFCFFAVWRRNVRVVAARQTALPGGSVQQPDAIAGFIPPMKDLKLGLRTSFIDLIVVKLASRWILRQLLKFIKHLTNYY